MPKTNRRRRNAGRLAPDVFSELELRLGDEHPLHRLLHSNPKLQLRTRRIAKLARKIEPRVQQKEWMTFCDERANLHTEELEIAYNLGFQNGALAAHAERFPNAAPRGSQEASLARDVRALLLFVSVSRDRAAATLLSLALALLRSKRVAHPRRKGTRSVRH